jgi:hypothetical protein
MLKVLAAMAELVDALDSGSSRGNSVDVRVILAAFFCQLGERSFILVPLSCFIWVILLHLRAF